MTLMSILLAFGGHCGLWWTIWWTTGGQLADTVACGGHSGGYLMDNVACDGHLVDELVDAVSDSSVHLASTSQADVK
jgi:hypothetical protein